MSPRPLAQGNRELMAQHQDLGVLPPRLPPRQADSADGSIEAPVGSEVTLRVDATEPLDVATMTIGAESVPMAGVKIVRDTYGVPSVTGATDQALWWGAGRLFARRPERFATILGCLILCVVVIDWLYVGIVVPRLPALPASPLWDISQTSLRPVRSILLTASVAATALIVWDLVWRQGKE